MVDVMLSLDYQFISFHFQLDMNDDFMYIRVIMIMNRKH